MIERFDPDGISQNHVYRVFAREHCRRYLLAAERIREMGLTSPTILDAASGTGYGTRYLAPCGNYLGLDRWEGVDQARRRYPYHDFQVCDLEGDFNYGVPRPDAIVSLETAEHLVDPDRFLRTCHHLLSPGRPLFFSAPTSLTRDFDPFHRHDRSAADWRDALRRAGFMVLEEIAMPFTARFAEFLGTVPTTWRQRGQVGRFLLTHPRYLVDRLWNWGLRGRFEWCSTFYACLS